MLPILQQIIFRIAAISLRVGGLMSFAPFIGDASIPVRIKAVFTLAITALLYPICPIPQVALTLVGLGRLVISEAVLGLGMGLCLQFIFEGAVMAGQLAGFQFAFSLVNIIDPQTNVDTPVLSVFHQLFALLLFLQFNVHHWLLRGISKSFEYVPVGSVVVGLPAVKELFRDAGGLWLVGVQIATPILLSTMLIDVAVGFLSKASPQMPAILFSIPVKSLLGYAILAMIVSLWPVFFERQFAVALGWSERLLHLAH
ncbi:MAG: flagellar biosynthetic protein FliR [Candidatus Acidiferrum sp.]